MASDSWPEQRKQVARQAAIFLRQRFNLGVGDNAITPDAAVILGTGWGETLPPDPELPELPLHEIPGGFNDLGEIEGHARRVALLKVGGKRVIALRGRVHLNESFGAACSGKPASTMLDVRLHVQMLLELGVKRLVLTAAVGSLHPEVKVGDVVVVDGFVTLFAPDMPLFGGEFCSPEDALDQEWAKQCVGNYDGGIFAQRGGHAMVRGPFFEGRRYDKDALAKSGARCVGMSILPEACIAALYPDVRVLALGHVTNSAFEEHSHETNQQRSKERAEALGACLNEIISL